MGSQKTSGVKLNKNQNSLTYLPPGTTSRPWNGSGASIKTCTQRLDITVNSSPSVLQGYNICEATSQNIVKFTKGINDTIENLIPHNIVDNTFSERNRYL